MYQLLGSYIGFGCLSPRLKSTRSHKGGKDKDPKRVVSLTAHESQKKMGCVVNSVAKDQGYLSWDSLKHCRDCGARMP